MADFPEIDVTKIDFPSDELTIKSIRQRWQQAVDTRIDKPDSLPRPFGPPAGELLHNMLTMERDLAKAAFGFEFGIEPSILYVEDDVKLLAADLSELYVRFGIADGPSTASELIRGIEAQATAQARQHLPPRS